MGEAEVKTNTMMMMMMKLALPGTGVVPAVRCRAVRFPFAIHAANASDRYIYLSRRDVASPDGARYA